MFDDVLQRVSFLCSAEYITPLGIVVHIMKISNPLCDELLCKEEVADVGCVGCH